MGQDHREDDRDLVLPLFNENDGVRSHPGH
jgi:hypothetical protein